MDGLHSDEVWQVEVGGQVYEAPFDTLPEWISEGSLQPDDKVRKGNLRWIEARRVPKLVPFFNAKAAGLPMPVVVSTTSATPDPEPPIPASLASAFGVEEEQRAGEHTQPQIAQFAQSQHGQGAIGSGCKNHPDINAAFVCESCGNQFCRSCPRSYGGTVRICPECGQMCRSVEAAAAEKQKKTARAAAMAAGFGSGDFFAAIQHPLKFKSSLAIGAVMFMFFTLGQSAGSMGSIFLAAGALICVMLSNMLTFGILANVVNNFTQGDLDADFMPSFEDFSLWSDVVHPFFLSIGVYIVSFGPFIATFLIGLYLVVSAVTTQIESIQSDLERIPGTHYYSDRDTVAQSEQVKKILTERSAAAEDRFERHQQAASGNSNSFLTDDETREQEELWEMIQESRKREMESMIGPTAETEEAQFQAMITGFLRLAAPLVVIGMITLLWGVLFFPAACAVAGYTRSFMATVNPFVGLDTIRRLGASYIKILLMYFCLAIAVFIVSAILSAIFFPFYLPRIGNIPATAIGALFTFYISVVFACMIGYALFKNANKLRLPGQ